MIVTNWTLHYDKKLETWGTEQMQVSPSITFIKSNTGNVYKNNHSTGERTTYYGYYIAIEDFSVVDTGINFTTKERQTFFAGKGHFKKNKTRTKYEELDDGWTVKKTVIKQKFEVHSDYDEVLDILKSWERKEPIELCPGGFPINNHTCTFSKRKGKIRYTCKVK